MDQDKEAKENPTKRKMKSLNQKSNYRKGKSVINDNKLECKGENNSR